MQKIGTIIQLL